MNEIKHSLAMAKAHIVAADVESKQKFEKEFEKEDRDILVLNLLGKASVLYLEIIAKCNEAETCIKMIEELKNESEPEAGL